MEKPHLFQQNGAAKRATLEVGPTMPDNNITGICTQCGAERRTRLNRKKGESAFRPCLPCHRIWKANYKINGPQPTNICRECGAEKETGKPCIPCKRKRNRAHWKKTYVRSTRESHLNYLKCAVDALIIDPTKHWNEYPCLEWPFGRDKDGYGKVTVDRKGRRSHRIAFELAYGKISEDDLACHHCDNPACISPPHIFIGTVLDNNRDRVAKGRSRYCPARGERAAHSKLTAEKVLEIRALRRQGLTCAEISRKYNVSDNAIAAISRKATWAHVQDSPDDRLHAADPHDV